MNLKNISIWKDFSKNVFFPKLNRDVDTDVLIIGGGITGVSLFYHLRNSKYKVILTEQSKIGFSVTGNSTGKLNFLQNDLINKIRDNFGDKNASLYLKSQKQAISMIVDTISKEKIECDLKRVKSYLYTNKSIEIDKIKNLEKFLNKNGIETFKGKSGLVKSKYSMYVEDTYMFNPIKFVQSLVFNFNGIYEKTVIKKIEKVSGGYKCYTDSNIIKAKYVMICSHYPYFNFPFLFPLKGSLEKSYLSASKCGIKDISLISYSNPFISLRTYNDYLVYLSNSMSLSKCVYDKKNFDELLKKVSDLNLKPDYLWSNIDIMTNDGLPYIGRLKDNMFIATGYNTWGLTNGFLAGKILSDMLLNVDNEYVDLFNPNRINVKKCLNSFTDIFKNLEGYVNGMLSKKNSHMKCPHMGCGLIYNEIEKTFDCPCHGSRFDHDGKCISGPANRNL